jgi:hypothetical protein
MQTVFDAPVPPNGIEDEFRAGLRLTARRQAIDHFTTDFACGKVLDYPFYPKNLANVREINVLVQDVVGPDPSCFQSAMPFFSLFPLRGEKR